MRRIEGVVFAKSAPGLRKPTAASDKRLGFEEKCVGVYCAVSHCQTFWLQSGTGTRFPSSLAAVGGYALLSPNIFSLKGPLN